MIKYYLILFSIIIVGCAGGQLNDSYVNIEKKTFMHDLLVEVNGEKFIGSGVLKKAAEYKVTVFPEQKIDRIIFTTCHMQKTDDAPKTDGIFKKSVSITLRDIPNVVDVFACSLGIVTFNEKTRENGFARLMFSDSRPEVSLPVLLKCNGAVTFYRDGVSICHAPSGLIQQLTFSEPVVQAGSRPECDVMKAVDDKTFTFYMPPSQCTYYFVSNRKLNGKNVVHRFHSIGFTAQPVKE
jgi:hypothetical protein